MLKNTKLIHVISSDLFLERKEETSIKRKHISLCCGIIDLETPNQIMDFRSCCLSSIEQKGLKDRAQVKGLNYAKHFIKRRRRVRESVSGGPPPKIGGDLARFLLSRSFVGKGVVR